MREAEAKLHRIAVPGRKQGNSYGNRRVCKQKAKCSPATDFKTHIHSPWMHKVHNTENKKKDFTHCNVENSLYLLTKMMDDLTHFKKTDPLQDYRKIRDRTLLDIYPTRSVIVDDEMCSRAKLEKLTGGICD